MQLDGLEVIVVGGAIGGAAAALLLAGAGARVTLLEKIAAPRAVGAGIGLAGNGLAVLAGLGLGDALERLGRPVDGARLVDGTGRTLLAPGGPRILMIRRAELHELLLDAIAAQPRLDARFGAEVVSAAPDGTVVVRGDGGDRTLRGALVIGADGVHSTARAGGDFGARVTPPGVAYLRGLVGPDLGRNEEAWTAAGLFGSFAVSSGTYFYASAGTPPLRAAVAARDLDGLRAAWAHAYPPSAAILAAVARFDDLLVNPVVRVRCRRFFDDRLVLIGDAAHAMPPNLGQGANSALVDAAVLLDELRRADGLPAALDAYDRRRRPAVQWVADTAARLGGLAERTSRPVRWLRDRVLMPLAGRADPQRTERRVLQEPVETLAAIVGRQ